MRDANGRCVAVSFFTTFAHLSSAAHCSAYSCGSTAFLRRLRMSSVATLGSCCRVCSKCDATAAAQPVEPHIILRQLRHHFSPAAVGAQRAENTNEEDLVKKDVHGPPPLQEVVACCEELCGPRAQLLSTAAEWTEAVTLLLRAVKGTRARRCSSSSNTAAVELSPWGAALRLFLHTPSHLCDVSSSRTSAQSLALCASLLCCCVHHGAPVDISRAVYMTLRSLSANVSAEGAAAVAGEGGVVASGWHVLYSRFLVRHANSAASEDAKTSLALCKEAMRVLLLDAAADGEELQVSGLMLSLELLRRLHTCGSEEKRDFEAVAASSSSLVLPQPPERTAHKGTATDVFWDCLSNAADVVTVARDVCCRVLCNRYVSLAVCQEAFCRFIAFGMCLSAEEVHPLLLKVHGDCKLHDLGSVKTPRSYVKVLDFITSFLDVNCCGDDAAGNVREVVVRVLEKPCVMRRTRHVKTKNFVSVWFVECILKSLAHFHRNAIRRGAHSDKDALESWRLCTGAALRCLQRVLMHLPDDRRSSVLREQRLLREARQTVFRLLFYGVLDGVFYSAPTPGRAAVVTLHEEHPFVMTTLIQAYAERDWHSPSVEVFIECLHAWRFYDLLRRVFTTVYQRSDKGWRNRRERDKKSEKANSQSLLHLWRPSLCLSTCHLVVQSSCDNDDPMTAAFAVRYMLRSLIAMKHNKSYNDDINLEENSVKNVETKEQTIEMWTKLICEEIIPSVDEAFRRTGTDMTQQWLGELNEEDVNAA